MIRNPRIFGIGFKAYFSSGEEYTWTDYSKSRDFASVLPDQILSTRSRRVIQRITHTKAMGSFLLAEEICFDVVHRELRVADNRFAVVRTLAAVDDIRHREVEASFPRTVRNPLAMLGKAQTLLQFASYILIRSVGYGSRNGNRSPSHSYDT
jgi:hypothetical protein